MKKSSLFRKINNKNNNKILFPKGSSGEGGKLEIFFSFPTPAKLTTDKSDFPNLDYLYLKVQDLFFY